MKILYIFLVFLSPLAHGGEGTIHSPMMYEAEHIVLSDDDYHRLSLRLSVSKTTPIPGHDITATKVGHLIIAEDSRLVIPISSSSFE